MKKTYNEPQIEIVDVNDMDVIRTSDGDIGEFEGLFPAENNAD